MLRAGRFRHRLLDEGFLQKNSQQAHRSLLPFVELWQKQKISDFEMVCCYLLVFSFLRRPLDFLGGPHNLPLPYSDATTDTSAQFIIETFKSTLPSDLASAKSLQALQSPQSFVQAFCSRSWRSIPFAVQRSVVSWQAGLYPLQLMTTVPTAEDVLYLQANGERCLSMLISLDEITNFVGEGRDVLGFLIHDLIHADHFFHDPEKAQAQVLFCQKLTEVYRFPFIQEWLHTDPVFQEEFHYLMADMNSVPLHLLKTLKALLLGFYKRQASIDLKSSLPKASEAHFQIHYETVLKPWNLSPAAIAAAHRLNTPDYRSPEDSLLLDQALSQKQITLSEKPIVKAPLSAILAV